MLSDRTVSVFDLEVPYSDVLTVEEREGLELLSLRAATEGLADSRTKYEALRIIVKSRLNKELPAWRSKLFDETYRSYFADYEQIDAAATELCTPFAREQDVKTARRQAAALAASGNAAALRAIIEASGKVMEQFRLALTRLEAGGGS